MMWGSNNTIMKWSWKWNLHESPSPTPKYNYIVVEVCRENSTETGNSWK